MIDYHLIYRFILPLHILFCLLLGICFYLIKHEGKPKLKGYYIGRHIIAAGYLLLGLACFIEYYFLQDESIYTTQIVFLISNAFDTSLFALGLTKMVDIGFITRRRIAMEAAFILLVSGPLLAIYISIDTASPSLTLQIAFLCSVAAILIKQIFNYHAFRKRYIAAKAQLDNYYSNDMGVHLDWVNSSFVLITTLMIIALVGCTIPYFWVVITLILIIWASFLYIFISTINYAPKIMLIEYILEDNDNRKTPDIAGTPVQTDGKTGQAPQIPVFAALDKWVAEGHFTSPGITIEEVASSIGTNRNKISLHLNTYLNLSFREWITKLRIEKARELLLTKPDLPISEIGTMVSIPNRSNFDKMFKKIIGESPSVYRRKNGQADQ